MLSASTASHKKKLVSELSILISKTWRFLSESEKEVYEIFGDHIDDFKGEKNTERKEKDEQKQGNATQKTLASHIS